MSYFGDFPEDQTVYIKFHTSDALAGSPALSVYKDNGVSESTAGVTLSVDFDSRTNYHLVTIVTTDAFYATGSDYDVVFTAGTVGGTSVVGQSVGKFSVCNRSNIRVGQSHTHTNDTSAASEDVTVT